MIGDKSVFPPASYPTSDDLCLYDLMGDGSPPKGNKYKVVPAHSYLYSVPRGPTVDAYPRT